MGTSSNQKHAFHFQLLERLKKGDSICIVVPPGGEQSIAALQSLKDNAHFEETLWANLGRQFVMVDEVAKWADALKITNVDSLVSDEDWKQAVRTSIGDRRLLIVLDDVHHPDKASDFKELGANCVYVMVTRQRDIADTLVQRRLVAAIMELNEFADLQMMKNIAPKAVEFDPLAAEAIASALKNSPLALTLISKYLKKMSSREDPDHMREAFRAVRELLESLKQNLAKEVNQPFLVNLLDLSYSALESENALRIFLFLSIFYPKPKTFSKNIAIKVCDADIDTIYELTDLGLIEHFGGDDYTMHPVIRNFAAEALNDIDPEASAKLHGKALDYYAQKLRSDTGDRLNVYRSNYRLDQADWQAIKDAWFYHLIKTEDVERATLSFLRVYFDAFWSRSYYQRFSFCDALIHEWGQRAMAPTMQQELALLIAFQEAYPTGHEKRGKGNWGQVESALKGIRELLNLNKEDGILPSEDARRVRAFTDFFLAEACGYGRSADWENALGRYNVVHDVFARDVGKREAAWVWFYTAQFLLEQGNLASARDYAVRSLTASSEAAPLGERDIELLANNYRLLGDLSFMSQDLEIAIRHYRRAGFYAYVFQGIPEAADVYSMALYREITGRIAQKAIDLYAANQKQGLRLRDEIRKFWTPYWSLHSVQDVDPTNIDDDSVSKFASLMFPPPLPDDEIKERASAYQAQVISITRRLQETLEDGRSIEQQRLAS